MLIRRLFGSHDQYYRLLNLKLGASESEIKAAYKKLVKEFHPDTSPLKDKKLAEEQFKNITEARNYLLENPYDPSKASPFEKKGYDFNEQDFSYENFKKRREEWKKHEFRRYQEKQREQQERERKHQENWERMQREKYNMATPEHDGVFKSLFAFFLGTLVMWFIVYLYQISKMKIENVYHNSGVPAKIQYLNAKLAPATPTQPNYEGPDPHFTRKPEMIELANRERKPRKILHYLGESGPHKKYLEVTKSSKNPKHSLYKCITCKVIISEPFIEQHVKENEVVYEFE